MDKNFRLSFGCGFGKGCVIKKNGNIEICFLSLEKIIYMTNLPKALIHVKTSFAVQPTEQQLLEFFKEYGYESLDAILEDFGGGDWNEVIREWFVNTYYGADYRELCEKKNILRYESDGEEEDVEMIDDEEWDELKKNDLIF